MRIPAVPLHQLLRRSLPSLPPFASLRRYPNRYESIIGTLCDSLESLDEPEAKASMIWIIGEYAERIDNAGGWVG